MVQPRIGDNETVGMMVRMKADLRDRIKAAADQNGRSQNSEIVATLEKEYPAPSSDADIAVATWHALMEIMKGDPDYAGSPEGIRAMKNFLAMLENVDVETKIGEHGMEVFLKDRKPQPE